MDYDPNDNIFVVVQDDEGVLRPMAGIWRDDEHGAIAAKLYLKKNPEVTLVKVQLVRI